MKKLIIAALALTLAGLACQAQTLKQDEVSKLYGYVNSNYLTQAITSGFHRITLIGCKKL